MCPSESNNKFLPFIFLAAFKKKYIRVEIDNRTLFLCLYVLFILAFRLSKSNENNEYHYWDNVDGGMGNNLCMQGCMPLSSCETQVTQ